jgi:hypothetical protein
MLLPDELVETAGPHPNRERRLGRRHAAAAQARSCSRVEELVSHCRQY